MCRVQRLLGKQAKARRAPLLGAVPCSVNTSHAETAFEKSKERRAIGIAVQRGSIIDLAARVRIYDVFRPSGPSEPCSLSFSDAGI